MMTRKNLGNYVQRMYPKTIHNLSNESKSSVISSQKVTSLGKIR